jgi:hypothetical protein
MTANRAHRRDTAPPSHPHGGQVVWYGDVTGAGGGGWSGGEVVEEEGCPGPEQGGAAVYVAETGEMLVGKPEGILVLRCRLAGDVTGT